MSIRAVVADTVVAESDATRVVEGNHYFPEDAVRWQHLERSRLVTVCPWKGVASYYHLRLDGGIVRNVAWQYRRPWPWARMVRRRVAFDPRVRVGSVSEDADRG